MKEISVTAFKERLAAVFKDLAESERAAHRSSFDLDALGRADIWERAASLAMALPSSAASFAQDRKDDRTNL